MTKEDHLQINVAKYLDYLQLLWFHCPNETKGNIAHYKKRKRKGVKSGVPDVLILEPVKQYRGLAIELKVGGNRITDSQSWWLTELNKRNFVSVVCYSFDEVQQIVQDYLDNNIN